MTLASGGERNRRDLYRVDSIARADQEMSGPTAKSPHSWGRLKLYVSLWSAVREGK